MKSKNLLRKAYENAICDRDKAIALLQDSLEEDAPPFYHSKIGPTLAKYLESLARSNEQIIKIGAILSKKEAESSLNEKTSEEMLAEMFDNLEKEEQENNK